MLDRRARAAWDAARPGRSQPVDTACPAPWVSIEFDPAGWVYACCTSQMYPLGRIGRDRLGDLWNGARAEVLREALRSWDLTVACGPCRWHLEHGRTDPVAATYDAYPIADDVPATPHMMLFALSNRCNLGCVMCNPELSSTLRAEAGLPPIESPYDDEFFEDLEELLPGVRLVKFLGGEPFLAPEHRRVWDLMAELPDPPRQQITTNGTVWTPNVEWVLDRFDTDISISVDAVTAPTYAAIRRGGRFEQLVEHLERFRRYCAGRGTDFHISYCLMDRNWSELGRFLAWAEELGTRASINLVTDTGLALHDLPDATLDEVARSWEQEDRELSDRLELNLPVWRTQLAQLESVRAERRAGYTPAPRQAVEADGSFVVVGRTPGPDWSPVDDDTVAAEAARLRRWSTDGRAAEVVVDPGGVVTAVVAPHGRLGIDDRLVGTDLTGLLDVVRLADGRPAWGIEASDGEGASVRSFVLAAERPGRGATGSIVRTVHLPRAGGTTTVLLAEDRMYDDGAPEGAVAVAAPVRRG